MRWGDEPLSIDRRQVRALLYRLAASAEPVPRQQLCFLFWPDRPERQARLYLSRLLTHLRRALPAAALVQATAEEVALRPLWSDAVTFERLLDEGGGTLPPLQQATALYRAPFLDGFSLPAHPEYEAWLVEERQSLERRFLNALLEQMEILAAQGEYEAAIACARRYLAADELAEHVHRRLIEWLTIVGDRSGALQQFERCVAVLERELGISPLPETRAAYLAAQQGHPASVVSPIAWTTLPSLDAPLIERDEVLERLNHACRRAQSGDGQVVLLFGEPGIGKSRLMQDFALQRPSRTTLLFASGHETEQDVPYAPLVTLLRPLLTEPDAHLTAVPVWQLVELSRLLPEIRAVFPDLPPLYPAPPTQERVRLFEAISGWLLTVAVGRPPLVLCVDDLHWVDEATLAWLGYFSRQIVREPVLIVGACRTAQRDRIAALRAVLRRQVGGQEITLQGLTLQGVARLVAELSGAALAVPSLVDRLHRETGGNPFFLLEVLRVMLQQGILRAEEGEWRVKATGTGEAGFPIPETVQQAIQDRLHRLPAQCVQVLEAAAVLGQPFEMDVLWRTCGFQEEEVVRALEHLKAQQLIFERGGHYHFHHDLIRAVVYGQIGYGRRRLLHRRAGEALEVCRPRAVVPLSRHFEAAEEASKTARYALQAGLAARDVFAYDQARVQFDRALAALEREAKQLQEPQAVADNLRRRIQAFEGRGWVFRLVGDMESYVRDSQAVARLVQQLGDPSALAHLRWREAYAHRWFCQYEQAYQAALEGVRLSRAAGDRALEARCWREVGMVSRERGHYHEAQEALEQALSLFTELDQTVYEIHTLGNLSTLSWYRGEYQQAMALAQRALTRCEERGLPLERRLPLGDMGVAAAALGDFDMARRCLEESLAIARQVADCTQEILCLGHLGWLNVQCEQPKEALEHLQAALALAETVGSCGEQSWLLAGLAAVWRLVGDLTQAEACAQRSLDMARRLGRPRDAQIARQVLP